MNVERIYSAYRDEAIAHQFTSEKYETFVAMPFKRLFSYNYERVLADVPRSQQLWQPTASWKQGSAVLQNRTSSEGAQRR